MNTVFACILAILLLSVPACVQQRVSELHPLLPYVFFESGSAVIPSRYQVFESADQTQEFSEANLPPNSLDVYHDILNIVGLRMQKHPQTTIEITGCNSSQKEIGEVHTVSEARGRVVYDYLVKIWGIDTSRIKLLPARDLPMIRSNIRDPLGIVENRRAEIITYDWELIKPIITIDPTPRPELGDSTLDIYNLILFKFDSPEAGPINERIIKEYIITNLRKGARIQIVGYTDVVGLDDRGGLKLHHQRANTVSNLIKREVKPGIIASLDAGGAGEDPIHSIDFPEGRFYNRCVQVRVMNNEQ